MQTESFVVQLNVYGIHNRSGVCSKLSPGKLDKKFRIQSEVVKRVSVK